MKNEICCFTGHRSINGDRQEVYDCLKKKITELIGEGVCDFLAGGALGFDTMAAQAVLELKGEYPDIRLILILPCRDQTRRWRKADIDIYEDIKSRCDKFIYTSEEFTKSCMFIRNRCLVDNSAHCICYITQEKGGTAYTVKYAKSKGLQIYNIADMVYQCEKSH